MGAVRSVPGRRACTRGGFVTNEYKFSGLRRTGLWVALAVAAVLLVALAPPAPNAAALVQSVPRPALATPSAARPRQTAPTAAQSQVLRVLPRRVMDAAPADGGALWALPPAAPAPVPPPRNVARAPATVDAAPAPAPAAAPPLPFRLIGRYADGEREGVVLQGPEGEVFIAHAGETLAGNYRVESLSGNLMVLHYLPLDLRQTMDIGVAR